MKMKATIKKSITTYDILLMKNYVFLAEGFEEVEALTPVDVLRRADMDVKTVSITDSHKVKGAHGITVEADITFKQADFSDTDWLIVPGGMPGAANLHAFSPLNDLLKVHAMNGGHIAAICAAPAVVLAAAGLLEGKEATAYPGFEDGLEAGGATHKDARVVVDGKTVTSNGPSSALVFALKLVSISKGEDVAQQVAAGMLLYPGTEPYYF